MSQHFGDRRHTSLAAAVGGLTTSGTFAADNNGSPAQDDHYYAYEGISYKLKCPIRQFYEVMLSAKIPHISVLEAAVINEKGEPDGLFWSDGQARELNHIPEWPIVDVETQHTKRLFTTRRETALSMRQKLLVSYFNNNSATANAAMGVPSKLTAQQQADMNHPDPAQNLMPQQPPVALHISVAQHNLLADQPPPTSSRGSSAPHSRPVSASVVRGGNTSSGIAKRLQAFRQANGGGNINATSSAAVGGGGMMGMSGGSPSRSMSITSMGHHQQQQNQRYRLREPSKDDAVEYTVRSQPLDSFKLQAAVLSSALPEGLLLKYKTPVNGHHNLIRIIFTPYITKVEKHETVAEANDPAVPLKDRMSTNIEGVCAATGNPLARIIPVTPQLSESCDKLCTELYQGLLRQGVLMRMAVLYCLELNEEEGKVVFLWPGKLELRQASERDKERANAVAKAHPAAAAAPKSYTPSAGVSRTNSNTSIRRQHNQTGKQNSPSKLDVSAVTTGAVSYRTTPGRDSHITMGGTISRTHSNQTRGGGARRSHSVASSRSRAQSTFTPETNNVDDDGVFIKRVRSRRQSVIVDIDPNFKPVQRRTETPPPSPLQQGSRQADEALHQQLLLANGVHCYGFYATDVKEMRVGEWLRSTIYDQVHITTPVASTGLTGEPGDPFARTPVRGNSPADGGRRSSSIGGGSSRRRDSSVNDGGRLSVFATRNSVGGGGMMTSASGFGNSKNTCAPPVGGARRPTVAGISIADTGVTPGSSVGSRELLMAAETTPAAGAGLGTDGQLGDQFNVTTSTATNSSPAGPADTAPPAAMTRAKSTNNLSRRARNAVAAGAGSWLDTRHLDQSDCAGAPYDDMFIRALCHKEDAMVYFGLDENGRPLPDDYHDDIVLDTSFEDDDDDNHSADGYGSGSDGDVHMLGATRKSANTIMYGSSSSNGTARPPPNPDTATGYMAPADIRRRPSTIGSKSTASTTNLRHALDQHDRQPSAILLKDGDEDGDAATDISFEIESEAASKQPSPADNGGFGDGSRGHHQQVEQTPSRKREIDTSTDITCKGYGTHCTPQWRQHSRRLVGLRRRYGGDKLVKLEQEEAERRQEERAELRSFIATKTSGNSGSRSPSPQRRGVHGSGSRANLSSAGNRRPRSAALGGRGRPASANTGGGRTSSATTPHASTSGPVTAQALSHLNNGGYPHANNGDAVGDHHHHHHSHAAAAATPLKKQQGQTHLTSTSAYDVVPRTMREREQHWHGATHIDYNYKTPFHANDSLCKPAFGMNKLIEAQGWQQGVVRKHVPLVGNGSLMNYLAGCEDIQFAEGFGWDEVGGGGDGVSGGEEGDDEKMANTKLGRKERWPDRQPPSESTSSPQSTAIGPTSTSNNKSLRGNKRPMSAASRHHHMHSSISRPQSAMSSRSYGSMAGGNKPTSRRNVSSAMSTTRRRVGSASSAGAAGNKASQQLPPPPVVQLNNTHHSISEGLVRQSRADVKRVINESRLNRTVPTMTSNGTHSAKRALLIPSAGRTTVLEMLFGPYEYKMSREHLDDKAYREAMQQQEERDRRRAEYELFHSMSIGRGSQQQQHQQGTGHVHRSETRKPGEHGNTANTSDPYGIESAYYNEVPCVDGSDDDDDGSTFFTHNPFGWGDASGSASVSPTDSPRPHQRRRTVSTHIGGDGTNNDGSATARGRADSRPVSRLPSNRPSGQTSPRGGGAVVQTDGWNPSAMRPPMAAITTASAEHGGQISSSGHQYNLTSARSDRVVSRAMSNATSTATAAVTAFNRYQKYSRKWAVAYVGYLQSAIEDLMYQERCAMADVTRAGGSAASNANALANARQQHNGGSGGDLNTFANGGGPNSASPVAATLSYMYCKVPQTYTAEERRDIEALMKAIGFTRSTLEEAGAVPQVGEDGIVVQAPPAGATATTTPQLGPVVNISVEGPAAATAVANLSFTSNNGGSLLPATSTTVTTAAPPQSNGGGSEYELSMLDATMGSASSGSRNRSRGGLMLSRSGNTNSNNPLGNNTNPAVSISNRAVWHVPSYEVPMKLPNSAVYVTRASVCMRIFLQDVEALFKIGDQLNYGGGGNGGGGGPHDAARHQRAIAAANSTADTASSSLTPAERLQRVKHLCEVQGYAFVDAMMTTSNGLMNRAGDMKLFA